jgi:L-lactate dehydrogenase complex protein LldG
MSRATILASIRAALCANPEDESRRRAVEARLAEPVRHIVPARSRRPTPELAEAFKAFLRSQGTDLIAVAEPGEIPGAIAGYLRAHDKPLRVRRGSDPYLAALPWRSEPELAVEEGPAKPDDGAGLSRAVAGVAETGTLMLASGPENPVTLAFLPEVHLVVLRKEAIVGAYEDALALVEAELGASILPRTLNLVSGPSRTGDIGGRIVMGAHGPKRLAVILV